MLPTTNREVGVEKVGETEEKKLEYKLYYTTSLKKPRQVLMVIPIKILEVKVVHQLQAN